MNHLTDFETAKDLKEAGFPQPKPEAGQYWYDPKDQKAFVIIETDETHVFWTTLNEHWDTGFFRIGHDDAALFVFAPTSADILGSAAMDVYSCALRWIAEKQESDYWENENKYTTTP